jgi:hypothetical protein
MDGSFACPECGSEVQIEGLAPGRQVRCKFCHRLLEVPYLPRAPIASWKRRRFDRWQWVRRTWMGVAVVAALGLVWIGAQFVKRQYRSAQEGSIKQLVARSREHEAAGRLGEALVDLDTALELARAAGSAIPFPMEEERMHRADLARREVQGMIDRLSRDASNPFPMGDWLTLRARSSKDPDLTTLKAKVLEAFHRSLKRRCGADLETARRELNAGRVLESLHVCDRIAKFLPYLPTDAEAAVRRDAEALVVRLVEAHGVTIETAKRGDFVFGSFENYLARLLPMLLKSLENKGYLPYRDTSPWKSAWQKAPDHLRLEVSERQMGNYLSSENRLSRIEAHLILTSPQRILWETRPAAQTRVPLPGLKAYESSRIAVNSARIEEFERRLYEDARGQIDEKFGQALGFMPSCCP